jgi:hypothetical protein
MSGSNSTGSKRASVRREMVTPSSAGSCSHSAVNTPSACCSSRLVGVAQIDRHRHRRRHHVDQVRRELAPADRGHLRAADLAAMARTPVVMAAAT